MWMAKWGRRKKNFTVLNPLLRFAVSVSFGRRREAARVREKISSNHMYSHTQPEPPEKKEVKRRPHRRKVTKG